MNNVVIYHNPRCSKSRQTLELLHSKNIEPEVIEYLNTPPDSMQLKRIVEMLEISPRDLMRKKETLYKEHALDNPELTEEQLLDAMQQNPILIERPIVLANGKAAIGRPPENVLEII